MTEWKTAATDDGQRFVYSERGSGPLVVLIHGFPDTPGSWERIGGALAKAGYRAVSPWLRGYRPETIVEGRPYDLVTIGEDAIRLLDALGERDAVLVGHDWGAAITYAAAGIAPERLRAAVPIAIPHPARLPRSPGALWAARHFAALNMPWAERKVRGDDFAYLDHLYERWSPAWRGADRDRSLAEAKQAMADPVVLKGAVDYYRALDPRIPKELKKSPPTPALVVAGTTDLDTGVYERSAEFMGPGSECMIVEGAGHWPHRENEDAFIKRLLAFLESVRV